MAADFLGETENAQPMPRVALHAWQIDLLHPITREGLLLQAGYPEDFSALVEAYRRLVI
jgi:hypothetical protein